VRDEQLTVRTTPPAREGDPTVVAVAGELDLATSPLLVAELDQARTQGNGQVVVDLSDCEFIDSSGINALVREHSELVEKGGRFIVVCSDPNILKVFEIAGLDRVLEVVSSLDDVGS
jgi:anti-sigma B factor antagonist